MKINKSIPRIIYEKKGQYFGMTLLTLISVMLFVLLTLTAQNLYVSKTEYVENNVREDLEFYSKNNIENISEIEETFDVKMERSIMTEYNFDGKNVRLFTPNDKVNIPAVIEGNLPNSGEIAFDPAFAKANGYNVGDLFEMNERSYFVSGIITLPNYSYILQKAGDIFNNPEFFGIGLLAKEDLPEGINLYSVKYNNSQDNIYEQAKPLKSYLNELGVNISWWEYARYNMKISVLDIEVKGIIISSIVVPIIFMLITALLIAIVQSKMIKQEAKNIGTLYALGYRKRELVTHYLRYPLIIAVSGGLLGGLAAMIALKPAINFLLSFFSIPMEEISYNPLYLIIGIVLCGLIFGLGSYVSLNKIFKQSPSQLMKTKEIDTTAKINFLERKINLSGKPFLRKFSIREQLRSISRLIFLVTGVMIATVFMMYGFIGESSFDLLLNPEESITFHSKIEYVMEQPQTFIVPDGGEAVSAWNMVPKNNFSDRFEFVGISENSQMISLIDKEGEELIIKTDEFIISSPMAKRYRLLVGDEFSFVDIINDNEYTVEITHIADIESGDFIFTSINSYDRLMNWEEGSYNVIMAKEVLEMPEDMVFKIKTAEVMSIALEKYTALMRYFIYGISAVAFALGLIIIYIIASVNIEENKQYISLMKVFGYRTKEIKAMMLNYSRIFVIIGFVLGVPLAYIVVNFMFTIMELFDISMRVSLNLIYILIGFIMIFLTFEVSKALCAKKVDKITLSEILKVQRD